MSFNEDFWCCTHSETQEVKCREKQHKKPTGICGSSTVFKPLHFPQYVNYHLLKDKQTKSPKPTIK